MSGKTIPGNHTVAVQLDMTDRKVFACLLCPGKFSTNDVRQGQYFPSTGICFACYEKKQRRTPAKDCFGKATEYDPENRACAEECPDRHICKVFILRKAA